MNYLSPVSHAIQIKQFVLSFFRGGRGTYYKIEYLIMTLAYLPNLVQYAIQLADRFEMIQEIKGC